MVVLYNEVFIALSLPGIPWQVMLVALHSLGRWREPHSLPVALALVLPPHLRAITEYSLLSGSSNSPIIADTR
jgi:hypothetical protein